MQDLRAHPRRCVRCVVGTKPVRLVVRDVIAAIVFEHQIDKTLEHAVQASGLERGPRFPIERQVAHELIEHLCINGVRCEPELHFGHV